MKATITAIAMTLYATQSFAASDSSLLAKTFMVQNVAIIQGDSTSDFERAAYAEEGPMVALVVAQTKDATLYYLEPSDVGAALVAVDHGVESVEIVKQAHRINCLDVRETFTSAAMTKSLCR